MTHVGQFINTDMLSSILDIQFCGAAHAHILTMSQSIMLFAV